MKLLCIGRNYAEHARELGNAVPGKPVVFIKPSTALSVNDKPFYYPDFTTNLHYECEVVLKICKNGRSVEPKFAKDYYNEVTVGIDFTARDLQDELKSKGQPWEIAKGFDFSAPIGKFIPLDEARAGTDHISFSLLKNGVVAQEGNTNDMLFSFDHIICYVSQFFTLHKGDMIFTGTPAGVGPVAPGDKLEAFINDTRLLNLQVK